MIEERQRAVAFISEVRRAAIEELDREGLTDAEIARRTGVTRQRVGQLLDRVTKIKRRRGRQRGPRPLRPGRPA